MRVFRFRNRRSADREPPTGQADPVSRTPDPRGAGTSAVGESGPDAQNALDAEFAREILGRARLGVVRQRAPRQAQRLPVSSPEVLSRYAMPRRMRGISTSPLPLVDARGEALSTMEGSADEAGPTEAAWENLWALRGTSGTPEQPPPGELADGPPRDTGPAAPSPPRADSTGSRPTPPTSGALRRTMARAAPRTIAPGPPRSPTGRPPPLARRRAILEEGIPPRPAEPSRGPRAAAQVVPDETSGTSGRQTTPRERSVPAAPVERSEDSMPGEPGPPDRPLGDTQPDQAGRTTPARAEPGEREGRPSPSRSASMTPAAVHRSPSPIPGDPSSPLDAADVEREVDGGVAAEGTPDMAPRTSPSVVRRQAEPPSPVSEGEDRPGLPDRGETPGPAGGLDAELPAAPVVERVKAGGPAIEPIVAPMPASEPPLPAGEPGETRLGAEGAGPYPGAAPPERQGPAVPPTRAPVPPEPAAEAPAVGPVAQRRFTGERRSTASEPARTRQRRTDRPAASDGETARPAPAGPGAMPDAGSQAPTRPLSARLEGLRKLLPMRRRTRRKPEPPASAPQRPETPSEEPVARAVAPAAMPREEQPPSPRTRPQWTPAASQARTISRQATGPHHPEVHRAVEPPARALPLRRPARGGASAGSRASGGVTEALPAARGAIGGEIAPLAAGTTTVQRTVRSSQDLRRLLQPTMEGAIVQTAEAAPEQAALPAPAEGAGSPQAGQDLESLAREVYRIVRRRLAVERERDRGRL
jgi:hypothetical protein